VREATSLDDMSRYLAFCVIFAISRPGGTGIGDTIASHP